MRVSFRLKEDRYFDKRYKKIMTELTKAMGNDRVNEMIESTDSDEWKVIVSGEYQTAIFNLTVDEFNKATSKKQSCFRRYMSILEYD